DVANFPDQLPQRVALVNSATILTERLGEADSGFRALHTAARQTIEATVATVNSLAEEIAAINHAVATSSGGTNTNDLLDQRDAAVSRLAELTGARVSQRDNGTIDVYVGNSSIVQGSRTFELSVTETADPGLTPVGLQRTDIMIGGSVRMTSLGGELAGHVSNVNSAIPSALSTLDGVAAQLISDVNALHATGEDLDGNVGGAFFSGTSAATISVDAAILADPRAVAAASPGSGIRDGEIALGIAELRNSATGADSLYESFSVSLGLATSSLQRRSSAQSEAAAKVDEARLAARSVSLDEEMVDLVATQRAYEASARVVSAIDQMLDTLVNRLGTVGR
ncbi:MAG TPA: flagellar hook-associated protein FlgK, partial [Acidimicrobiaceae bacterium]|nr:flagellar hook-associated protein FlgK [Acidimicrobiaceae bacterium]